MKNDIALLVGNDINGISKGITWKKLLENITDFCGVSGEIEKHEKKPFPILYEEIFLRAIAKKRIEENELKSFIADSVAEIKQNEIHERIRSLGVTHVMTTNYDYSLQGGIKMKNMGVVKETIYSIFRKNELGDTTYWHLHGEAGIPSSINLGYEHYCGQLQTMRNYMVRGAEYKNPDVSRESLYKQLKSGKQLNFHSWIDLFFTKDIHILGLKLDFVETDLWWLLTYRSRNKFYRQEIPVPNNIYYYIPKKYLTESKYKIDLLEANDVQVVVIDESIELNYYRQVLSKIS